MSITEYLLYKYKKTLKDLFEAKPVNALLLKKLEEAIEQWKNVFKVKKEREERIMELEKIVEAGGSGAPKAKAELMNLKMQDPSSLVKDEMAAVHAKLKAKRALANPNESEEEAYRQEQERLRQKEAEEKKKMEDSKARLRERAKMFN